MQEYLAFIDEIGRDINGGYIYRFDFTYDTEAVWGDFFNVAPSVTIPDLQPENNCLSRRARIVFPREMIIAKKSYCFSMQDCIDGICPLMFCEIDEDTLTIEDEPFCLKFGEPLETVQEKLSKINLELNDFEEVEKGDDSAIDNLINAIDTGDENNDDLDYE